MVLIGKNADLKLKGPWLPIDQILHPFRRTDVPYAAGLQFSRKLFVFVSVDVKRSPHAPAAHRSVSSPLRNTPFKTVSGGISRNDNGYGISRANSASDLVAAMVFSADPTGCSYRYVTSLPSISQTLERYTCRAHQINPELSDCARTSPLGDVHPAARRRGFEKMVPDTNKSVTCCFRGGTLPVFIDANLAFAFASTNSYSRFRCSDRPLPVRCPDSSTRTTADRWSADPEARRALANLARR